MIRKIEAANYRCLRSVSQTLGNFQVLTGPNGSGKSTFLEVPQLLAAFAREGLDGLWDLARAQSLEELLYHGQGRRFQLAVESRPPDSVLQGALKEAEKEYNYLRYELEIGVPEEPQGAEVAHILAENLWLMPKSEEKARKEIVQDEFEFPSPVSPDRRIIHDKRPKGWRKVAAKTKNQISYFRSETTEWNFQLRNPRDKSALSTLPEDERFALSGWFKAELDEAIQSVMLRSDVMHRSASPLKNGKFAPDGSNLPQAIRRLQNDHPSYNGWLEHVQSVLPIRSLRIEEKPEDRSLFFLVEYTSGHQVHSWHLSDGTLRLLALTLLPYLDEEGPVYLIEEPENGIHPQAIEAVYESLSSMSQGQVLVATHSPVLVAQVRPDQLLCFAQGRDDETDIIRGDQHPKLREWKGSLNLAQLYAAGVLS